VIAALTHPSIFKNSCKESMERAQTSRIRYFWFILSVSTIFPNHRARPLQFHFGPRHRPPMNSPCLQLPPPCRSPLIKAQLIDLRRRKHKDMHAEAKNAPKQKNLTLVRTNQGLRSKQNISTMPLQFESPCLWNRRGLQVLHMLLWTIAFVRGRAIDWMRLWALHQNLASLCRNGTAC
jgi:hypothetical protein